MDAEPPPLPTPKFTLTLAAWLLAGTCAVFSLVPAMLESTRGTLNPHTVGLALGSALGIFGFPLLLSWLVWRFGRRNDFAKHLVFFMVLGLASLGIAARVFREMRARLAVAQMQMDQRQLVSSQRDAIARGKVPDAKDIEAHQKRSLEQMRTAEANSTGDDRIMIEASRLVTERIIASQHRYTAAAKQLDVATFFDLHRLETKEAIATRRTAATEFRQANAVFQENIALGAFHLAQELKSRGLAQRKIDDAVAAYRATTVEKLPALKRIRETDAEFAEVLLEFLDLIEANLGEWEIKDPAGKITFEKDAAAKTYNELMQRKQRIGIQQANAQQQLLGVSGTGTTPQPRN